VFGIVQRAGGSIALDTAPGRGTSFAIELPAVELDANPGPLVAAVPLAHRPARILLVEDDPAVRDLADRVLTRAGHRLVVTGIPSEGLAAVESDAIDLLLTDVVMPELSGAALAARARALRPDLRVLFMSGHVEHAGAEALEIGPGDGFIGKPFTPAELVEAVNRTLDAPAAT
jgi:CheY-like chemotaxis protein